MSERNSGILDDAIEARMGDDAWSSSMARRVLGKRKTIIRRRMAGGIALAICAVIAGYLLFPAGTPAPSAYESLISSQVDGTYGAVFTSASASSAGDGAPFADIDSLVDSALARR